MLGPPAYAGVGEFGRPMCARWGYSANTLRIVSPPRRIGDAGPKIYDLLA